MVQFHGAVITKGPSDLLVLTHTLVSQWMRQPSGISVCSAWSQWVTSSGSWKATECSGLGPVLRSVRSCDQSLLESADSSMPTQLTVHHNMTCLWCHKKDALSPWQKTTTESRNMNHLQLSLIRLFWLNPEIFIERCKNNKIWKRGFYAISQFFFSLQKFEIKY